MARIRSIKPEFWDDETLAKISRDARLCYIGLWNHSDDYGVVRGKVVWLRSKLFPYDEDLSLADMRRWISELQDGHWIVPFDSNGELYFFIPNFLKHQNINRPSSHRNPEPPRSLKRGLSEGSVKARGGLSEGSSQEGRGKGGGRDRIVQEDTKEKNPPTPQPQNRGAGSAFSAPTVEEVQLLWRERSYLSPDTEPIKFHAYYASNGWRVGKNPMRDWRAAAAGWAARCKENGCGNGRSAPKPGHAITPERAAKMDAWMKKGETGSTP